MGINADIISDVQAILTDTDEYAVPVTLTTGAAYTPMTSVTGAGLAIKHSIVVNPQTGTTVRGKTARVTISEAAWVALNYPVRNSNNVVRLKDDLVSFVDSAGITYNGIVREVYPDETTGCIVCILGDNIT